MEKTNFPLSLAKKKWGQTGGHDKVIFVATFVYLAIITAFMIWHQEFFSPDRFFVFAFIAMIAGRQSLVVFMGLAAADNADFGL